MHEPQLCALDTVVSLTWFIVHDKGCIRVIVLLHQKTTIYKSSKENIFFYIQTIDFEKLLV